MIRKVWSVVQPILIALALVASLQSLPVVQRQELKVLAQQCGWNPGTTLTGSPICTTLGQAFLGGIQVGATGFPISAFCAVSATMNGTTEVDVTPSCTLPTSSAPSAAKGQLSEVVCTGFGSGPPIAAWIKNATQIAVSSSAGDTRTASCLVAAH